MIIKDPLTAPTEPQPKIPVPIIKKIASQVIHSFYFLGYHDQTSQGG